MALQVIVTHKETGEIIDLTPNVLGLSVSEAIDDSESTFSLTAKNIDRVHAFDDITITYQGKRLINGIISSQSDSLAAKYRRTSLKGSDFSIKLERRIVRESYAKVSAEYIIADLIAKYSSELTVNNVATSNRVIDVISFNYEPLKDCIDRLAKLIGWNWFIDANNDVHFFDQYEGTAPQITFTTANIRRDSVSLDYKVTKQTANRVWVIGAKTAGNQPREEYFVGDGNNRLFKIGSRPHDYEIFVNGVKVGADNAKADTPYNETDESVEWLVNFKEKYFRRSPTKPTPANGENIKFKYHPEIEIIDYFENPQSVAKYGLYEKAIKDGRITQKLTARQRGRSELKRNSKLLRVISFSTRELNVSKGRLIRVVIPELKIDSTWRITQINTSIIAPDYVNVEKSIEAEEVA